MARTHVITGSSSGIGEATVQRLRAKGHKVIGVDLRGADINVDLGTKEGRASMIEQVHAMAPEGVDGVLSSAGLTVDLVPEGEPFGPQSRAVKGAAVNYFGSIATLEGLRPLMNAGSRGVMVASAALLMTNDEVAELEELMLSGDEPAALKFSEKQVEVTTYAAGKRALTRWLRHNAPKSEWAGAGKLLNVVAPGMIKTPMVIKALADTNARAIVHNVAPIAVGDYGKGADVAELMDFLLNYETNYLVGQLIFIDGGTEIIRRPDHL